MLKKASLFLSAFFVVLLGITPWAKADTFDVVIGTTFSFDVSLDNTGNPELFLNGSNFTIDSPLVLNDLLFVNFPPSVPADGIVNGTLFTVDLPTGLTPGLYNGSYSILGGFNSTDQFDLADLDFTINAIPASSPVPEPGTWVLLVTGLGTMGLIGYSRRRQASLGRAA
jgi:hypothetical protein